MSSKINIQVVLIGHSQKLINTKILRKFRSNFFSIKDIEIINHLESPRNQAGYLNVVFDREEVTRLIGPLDYDGIIVAVTSYPFDDNFYLHRISDKSICISMADIDFLLKANDISLENFIIKNIYEIIVLHKIYGPVNTNEAYNFIHLDTRGCLFDMNGNKYDILFNTEKPVICSHCRAKLMNFSLPPNYIENLESELSRIKKSFIKNSELFIKSYPLFSLISTVLLTTIVNLFSTAIWKYVFE